MVHEIKGDLAGRTALVTGASSGIGAAIALELAAAGADVAVHARARREGADRTAAQIRAAGRRTTVLLYDLADPPQRDALVDRAWAWSPTIDVWVNNAGADVLTGQAAEWDFARKLDALWQVDVLGTIQLSRAVGARMRQHRSRSERPAVILNMGWDQAETGMAGDSGEMFAAAKGAIMAVTRSLARSLAPQVRVNCLAPGWIRTAWGAQASDYWRQRGSTESLLQRWGTPEDVARAARFLASPAADFITGQVVHINGGLRLGEA